MERDGNVVRVRAAKLPRDEYRVEGDYSSASYWFAAAAATRGTMRVRGLAHPTAQGDAAFLDILDVDGMRQSMFDDDAITVIGRQQLRGGTFDCNATPDIVPTLAAIAPLASSPVEIVNVGQPARQRIRPPRHRHLASFAASARRSTSAPIRCSSSPAGQPIPSRSKRTTTTASPWPSPSPASRAAT